MKVEFTPAEVQPITKENIIVAGQVIGTVEFSKADPANYRMKDRYHAALKMEIRNIYSLSGFGDTREAAIADALKSGKETAAKLAAEVDSLELQIMGIDGSYERDM